ncbi:MAG: DUF2333 family protein [Pseudomonadales bacterium]|nr:DUF2333 family protein [Pseudomonadales bacterium]
MIFSGKTPKAILAALAGLVLLGLVLGFFWSAEPDFFDVPTNQENMLTARQLKPVIGTATTATLITVAQTLLDKPGGYLSNDILPPGLWLDNIPNWEFGVLVQVRDISKVMRESFSRSQSQSVEDRDLIEAEPGFNAPNDRWWLPASENQYRQALVAMSSYLGRLADPLDRQAQFFARADNLNRWLTNVESRLGSLSQRLSASVAQQRANTDLAGEARSAQSTPGASELRVKTPWLEIDDVFFEARGSAWALVHLLRAVQIDFHDILADKNAEASMEQIIRELESSQQTVFSPMILNGSGFGVLANHSLVMASYISRANAALIDLRALLAQG